MGMIYTRDSNGNLNQVKTIRVIGDAVNGLDTEITEFSQINEYVVAYLTAADAAYTDDNGDSVSVMEMYQPIEEGHVYDKPLVYPLTVANGKLYLQNENNGNGYKMDVNSNEMQNSIYNVEPNVVSQYLIKDVNSNLIENKRIKPTGKVRMLKFCGYVRNCRDLGGWDCDGGTIKYGKLFRSGVISTSETWIDPQLAKNAGIHHQIDFRSDTEANYATESTLGTEVRYHRYPLELYYDDCINPSNVDYFSLKKIFRTIIEAAIHDEGVIYNCSLGRDRTGTVTFMLMALLGVAKADIDKDYELSSFSGITPLQYAYRTGTNYCKLASYLSSFGGATLRDNVVRWFIKSGFSLAELNAFRAAMTNGTPDMLTADNFVQTFTVNKYLTGCEISNADSSVEDGMSYEATLIFADGYNGFDSVNVTMGGVNVTADVYADGVITIPAVTGNVVITAVAVYVPVYTNQIPISTDTDGSIYNGTGYKKNVRINSSGAIQDEDNTYVTGFIPCKSGDVVRFVGMNLKSDSSVGSIRLAFYDASKNVVKKSDGSNASVYWSYFFDAVDADISASGELNSIIVPAYETDVAYARFSCYYIDKYSVITINEEIA